MSEILENGRVSYLTALEVCSRRGAIQIHIYLYLYLYQLWLGRQRQVWFISLADVCRVCR